MLISVGADEVLASDRMKCAKTNNFRLGHKLKTWSCTTTSVEHCLWPSSGIPTTGLMHLYLQRHPPYGAYTQAPSGYIPHGPPISRLLNPCNAIFNTLVLILLLITWTSSTITNSSKKECPSDFSHVSCIKVHTFLT